jgi:hypothetical protein
MTHACGEDVAMDPSKAHRPQPHEVVRVACHLVCDRRTVNRYFDGRPVNSTTRARIEEALVALGLRHLLLVAGHSNANAVAATVREPESQ